MNTTLQWWISQSGCQKKDAILFSPHIFGSQSCVLKPCFHGQDYVMEYFYNMFFSALQNSQMEPPCLFHLNATVKSESCVLKQFLRDSVFLFIFMLKWFKSTYAHLQRTQIPSGILIQTDGQL